MHTDITQSVTTLTITGRRNPFGGRVDGRFRSLDKTDGGDRG